MCFSASASFTAGAFLVPIGLYCVYAARDLKRYHYLMLALVPFFFGIQQLIEGGVWLSLGGGHALALKRLSIAFVFFSHFFWPFWIPLSAYFVAKNRRDARAWIKMFFAIVGIVVGLVGFVSFLFKGNQIQTSMCANSLDYSIHTVWHALIGTSAPKYVYITIIVLPLFISRDWAIKVFGALILVSVIITYLFFSYAFNSVWCFFSAVISMYVVYLIRRKKDHGLNYEIENL
jgi:hypothetical protein